MDWILLKDLTGRNSVELAEYVTANKIAEESAFKWCVNYTIKTSNQIMSEAKTKYWRMTHKFGGKLPKTWMKHCRQIRLMEINSGKKFLKDDKHIGYFQAP